MADQPPQVDHKTIAEYFQWVLTFGGIVVGILGRGIIHKIKARSQEREALAEERKAKAVSQANLEIARTNIHPEMMRAAQAAFAFVHEELRREIATLREDIKELKLALQACEDREDAARRKNEELDDINERQQRQIDELKRQVGEIKNGH